VPIRVRLLRGGVPESEHLAEGVVVDRMGTVLAATERPDWTTFFRSSAKPFQLLPLVERGHADRLGLTDRHLALMSASHNGAAIHVAGSREILAAAGSDESELECGYHVPEDPASARLLATADAAVKTAIWNNCSGKHAGMIALARAEGWTVRGYVAREHPVQRIQVEAIADVCGVDPARLPLATDGCSAVNPALPLVAMARGYARMAAARRDGGSARETALARIRDAMAAHPEMVAGEGRFCTALMRVTAGRLVTKTGAEGLQCVALPSRGLGIALRVKDGARRAVAPALVSWLVSLGLVSAEEAERLAEFARPTLVNHRGLPVGTLDASELPGWRSPAGAPAEGPPAARVPA
jgi:L-asparaginase II